MWDILLQTLPFFAIIGLGYGAGRSGFFTPEATAYLTKFVFYFALSAMLFRFSANLSWAELFDWSFVIAYLCGTGAVYLLATLVARLRGRSVAEAAFEAQCAAIGNIGFLGIPMLALLLGEPAVGYIVLMLAVDLIVFSSLIVVLVTGSREGLGAGVVKVVAVGLLSNPMIGAIVAGLVVSGLALPIPAPVNAFLVTLGAAATPGALFAIGASLASKSAERLVVAGWLSFAKLVLHPAAVAVCALWIFPVEPYAAGVMIAAASLPVAGNVYILAQHYGVAPLRVSAAILLSTAASVITVSGVIAWVKTFMP
jgi:malonate transporter and related proteins